MVCDGCAVGIRDATDGLPNTSYECAAGVQRLNRRIGLRLSSGIRRAIGGFVRGKPGCERHVRRG